VHVGVASEDGVRGSRSLFAAIPYYEHLFEASQTIQYLTKAHQQILCSGTLQGTPNTSKILFSSFPSTNVPSLSFSLP